jgi:hypothetical protein
LLEQAELEQRGVRLDHAGGVGEAPKRGGLTPCLFEVGQPSLASLDDLREQLLRGRRQHQVPEVHRQDLDADRTRRLK